MAQQVHDENQLRMSEFLANCMVARGFDYVVNPDAGRFILEQLPHESIRIGTREWAELFGFEISIERTLPARFGGVPAQDFREDPNREIHRTGTPAEIAAWNEALNGGEARLRWGDTPVNEIPEEDLGCMGLFHLQQQSSPQQFAPLLDEIGRFPEAVQNDPRTLDLDSEWGSCMARSGLGGWRNPRQLYDTLVQAWQSDHLVPIDAFRDWDWSLRPDGPQAAVTDPASFQARERELAIGDWDCRNELNYEVRMRSINFELQQIFVNQHRTELDLWVHESERAATLN
jgi:hypothetical protein